jgi:hypothetical protein
MRQRTALWVVLAGMVAGAVGIAALAGRGGGAAPARLPALASGQGGAAVAEAKARAFPAPARIEAPDGLPDLAGRAPAWTVGTEPEASRLRSLVAALGMAGEPAAHPGGWLLRDGDSELRIAREAGLPWFYVASAPHPCAEPAPAGPDRPVTSDGEATSCASAPAMPAGSAGGGARPGVGDTREAPPASAPPDGSASGCAPPPCPPDDDCPAPRCAPGEATTVEPCPMPPCPPGVACIQRCDDVGGPVGEPERPADLPTEAEATKVARRFLAAVGLDLTGADVRVTDGFVEWYVTVSPTLGGLPVRGWDWQVTVGPGGVVGSASGWLAEPARGDDYPLAGTAAGLERLRAGRWWLGWGGPVVLGAPERLVAPAPACEDCPAPEPVVRTVGGVRLALLFAPVAEQRSLAMFVPAYLFTLDDGEEVPVLAVADEFLPPEPEPAGPEPAPGVTEPGPGAVPPGGAEGSEPAP